MPRLLVAAALILTLSGIGMAAAGTGESSKRTARLTLASPNPLTLRGTGLRPGERVRVRAATDYATKTRRVSASAAGRFLVRFNGTSLDRCSGLLAEAVGSEGSVARFKRPQPLCPPN